MPAGGNPGTYHPYVQADLWPFVPALGVLVSVGLIILAVLLAMAAREQTQPIWRAWLIGVLALLLSWVSVTGLVAASDQWTLNEQVNHTRYLEEVRSWVESEVSAVVTDEQVQLLVDGGSVGVDLPRGPGTIHLERDNQADLLSVEIE